MLVKNVLQFTSFFGGLYMLVKNVLQFTSFFGGLYMLVKNLHHSSFYNLPHSSVASTC